MNARQLKGVDFEEMVRPEWLVTNGLGGYACSTISGANTRKYHGLLVAAMAPPVRRMVLLSKMEETVLHDGWPVALSCNEYPGIIFPQGHQSLRAFHPQPVPTWIYEGEGWRLQKELHLVKGENTVCVRYTVLDAKSPIQLQARPLFALRGMHELMYQWNGLLDAEKWTRDDSSTRGHKSTLTESKAHVRDWRIPPTSRTPEIFFSHDGAFQSGGVWYFNMIYRWEERRGYSGLEDLWNPGMVSWTLKPGESATFVCSSDPINFQSVVGSASADRLPMTSDEEITGPLKRTLQHGTMDALVRASEHFIIDLPQETGDSQIAVVAAYPWSPPTPRASLIGFTGLFLVPGRFDQARSLVSGLLKHLDKGLIPSEFPENGAAPIYKGADVSLWLINAVGEYLRYTGDEKSLRGWLDKLKQIVAHYRRGTSLGIAMDSDGLISSHEPGVGTSWMDIKVGDWVITPRSGRTVELNALWYNALCLVAAWSGDESLSKLAEKVKVSFNARFWNEQTGCCFDVINGGPDGSIRPNQLLAVSLRHPVLDIGRHERVLETVLRDLVTPMGVRTLSPKDPSYQARHRGSVVERDRSVHQGSAHAWLLGLLVSTYLRIHGRNSLSRRQAGEMLQGCLDHIDQHGQLPEFFDAEAPHAAGGAIASALAVGEILRAYVEDVMDVVPPTATASTSPVVATPLAIRPVAK